MVERSIAKVDPDSPKDKCEEIRIEDGVAIVSYRGEFSVPRFEQLFLALMAHPRFIRGMPAIYDFREASLSDVTSREILQLVKIRKEHTHARGEGHRVALVADGDVDYGVSRMFEGYSEEVPQELSVFRSFDEALSWASGR